MATTSLEASRCITVATSKRRNSSLSLKTSPKDDWSKIEDRKQRRRVQNRLCQRAFRQRTRAKENTEGIQLQGSKPSREINADTQGLRSPPSYEQYELQEVITQEGGQLKEGAREVPEHLELVSSWATQQDSGEPSQDTFETEAARTSEDSMMDPWCL